MASRFPDGVLADQQDVQAFLHTPTLSILTPRETLLQQLMERIAKRASAYHAAVAFTFARPISWRDGMLFTIGKTSGLGQNINFHIERGKDTIADFDIQSSIADNRWNLWHRIVGEDAADTRFRHQGHGSRILHSIETYLRAAWVRERCPDPPHEIVCSTNQEDVQRLLRVHQYDEGQPLPHSRVRFFHKTIVHTL